MSIDSVNSETKEFLKGIDSVSPLTSCLTPPNFLDTRIADVYSCCDAHSDDDDGTREPSVSERHLNTQTNDEESKLRTLMAMCVGLDGCDIGSHKYEIHFKKECLRPLRQRLIAESTRRCRTFGIPRNNMSPNTSWSINQIIRWLKKHPITDPHCKEYLRRQLITTVYGLDPEEADEWTIIDCAHQGSGPDNQASNTTGSGLMAAREGANLGLSASTASLPTVREGKYLSDQSFSVEPSLKPSPLLADMLLSPSDESVNSEDHTVFTRTSFGGENDDDSGSATLDLEILTISTSIMSISGTDTVPQEEEEKQIEACQGGDAVITPIPAFLGYDSSDEMSSRSGYISEYTVSAPGGRGLRRIIAKTRLTDVRGNTGYYVGDCSPRSGPPDDYTRRPNGHGKMTYPDGTVYQGEWSFGMWKGQARISYPDGSIYTGNVVDHLYHGCGKLTLPNGEEWEGEWINGQLQQR